MPAFTDLRTIFNNVWDQINSALRVEVVSGSGIAATVTIADGADTTEGSIADVAVTGDNPGTINAHLRGIDKLLTGSGSLTANQGTPNAAGTSSWPVQGAGPVGSPPVGNPIAIGGSDGTNFRAVDVSTAGSMAIGAMTGGGAPTDLRVNTTGLDASSNSVPMLIVQANQESYNGANWDRDRNNNDVTLLASASRTTTQTSADIPTYNLTGISVFLNMTVVGTGSVTVTIDGKDPASGAYYNLLTGAAVVTNVGNLYRVMLGIPAVANKDVSAKLPRTIRIVVTANNANAATYSVGYTLHV